MTTLKGSRVLVTGGAGFIGSHLVDGLVEIGAERVAVVDTFFLGREDNLGAPELRDDRIVVFREDAGDPGAMRAICDQIQPDVVFNLATKALLYSFFNPAGACRINLEIALTLCELLRNDAFGRLLHLSSSEVYGTAQYAPMDEGHPLLAETTYAAGKAAADLAVASYVRMFDVDAITVRPFNNYGPRQNDQAFAAVIPLTVRRIQAGEQPLVEGDGLQTRDFIFVRDTVDAIIRLATTDTAKGSVLNLGSGRETAIGTIVETIVGLMGWDGGIARAPARSADVRRHRADISRAEALIGPVATVPLDEGLRLTVEWYQDQVRR